MAAPSGQPGTDVMALRSGDSGELARAVVGAGARGSCWASPCPSSARGRPTSSGRSPTRRPSRSGCSARSPASPLPRGVVGRRARADGGARRRLGHARRTRRGRGPVRLTCPARPTMSARRDPSPARVRRRQEETMATRARWWGPVLVFVLALGPPGGMWGRRRWAAGGGGEAEAEAATTTAPRGRVTRQPGGDVPRRPHGLLHEHVYLVGLAAVGTVRRRGRHVLDQNTQDIADKISTAFGTTVGDGVRRAVGGTRRRAGGGAEPERLPRRDGRAPRGAPRRRGGRRGRGRARDPR